MKFLRASVWQSIFALVLCAVSFSYILKSGYFGDDAQNVDLPGKALLSGQTWTKQTINAMFEWTFQKGRPFPLSTYTVPLFHFLTSRVTFKLFAYFICLINFLSIASVIYSVSSSYRMAILFLTLLPTTVSSRYWYDPLLSFAGLIPIVSTLIFLSLLSFWNSIHLVATEQLNSTKGYRKDRSLYWISVFLFFTALLTYEISYLFCLFFPVLAFFKTKNFRRGLRFSFPYLLGSGGMMSSYFLLKSKWNPYYLGSFKNATLHLDPSSAIVAFKNQIHVSVPGFRYWHTHWPFWRTLDLSDRAIIATATGLFFWTLFTLYKNQKENEKRNQFNWPLTFVGLGLLLLPAFVVSISGHQQEIALWGTDRAYLPFLLQMCGIGLLFSLTLDFVLSRLDRMPILRVSFLSTLTLIFGLVFGHNWANNNDVVRNLNHGWLTGRMALENLSNSTFFEIVPSESLMLLNQRWPYETVIFFGNKLKRRINIEDAEKYSTSFQDFRILSNSKSYFLEYCFGHDPEDTRAILGKIEPLYGPPLAGQTLSFDVKWIQKYDGRASQTVFTFDNEIRESWIARKSPSREPCSLK